MTLSKKQRFAFHFTILGIMTFFLSLSYWQFHRGLEKSYLNTQKARMAKDGVLNVNDLANMRVMEDFNYRSAQLQGKFDLDHIFLLENQHYEHQVGYHVLIPFQASHLPWILIDLGWIPKLQQKKEESQLSLLKKTFVNNQLVTIKGYLKQPKHNIFVYNNLPNNFAWPQKVLEINLAEFSHVLKQPFFPMILCLHQGSEFGFIAAPLKQDWLSPSRHWGYALQWSLMALMVFAFYLHVWWKFRRNKHATDRNFG